MAVTLKSANKQALPLGAVDYSKHLGTKEVAGTLEVDTTSKDGVKTHTSTQIPVDKGMVDGGYKVGCSGSRTIALEKFESIKFGVWLEAPCTKDTIDSTYDFVTDWVGAQLSAAISQVKGK